MHLDENNETEHCQDQYREESVRMVVITLCAAAAAAFTVALWALYALIK